MPEAQISNEQFQALAKTYGTPLYIYSEAKIRQQFSALQEALSPLKPLICFAMKANSNLSILKLFRSLGAGFDIVSEGELRRALKVGTDPSTIVYSGVGKLDSEIDFALESKIKFFNVESAAELAAIERVAAKRQVKARYCFRINPDVRAGTHAYLTTGVKTSKFGIPVEEALELWQRYSASQYLEFLGLDCHIGSQITSVDPLEAAYREVLAVAAKFEKLGAEIKVLDLGGGLGISYSGHTNPLDLAAYSKMTREVFANTKYQLVFEPGRFLIAEAGVLLTRVIYQKQNNQKRFAIVDAGMNDLIRPSLYDAYHKIDLVSPAASPNGKAAVDIVGPVCESGCFFAKDRELPELSEGSLLAIRDAGAYGFVMASTYNTRALPAEVLLDLSGKAKLIRARDSYEDLFRSELELI